MRPRVPRNCILRKEAAFALGEIGDAGTVPALERALEDPEPMSESSRRSR
ncbi:MAG: hypothetical protein ABSB70_12140 [Candidatus Velthaea sp.]